MTVPCNGVGRELNIKRHNLPHWQMGGSVYFITVKMMSGTLSKDEMNIVKEEIMFGHGKKYTIIAAVVMSNHFHMLIVPLQKSDGLWYDLAVIMKFTKGLSARRINMLRGCSGSIWKAERYDRIIRNEKELLEKWNYILENPVRAGLVEKHEEYEFLSGLINYKKWRVIPDKTV
jgi:REP element-mobilizing transposase RayT